MNLTTYIAVGALIAGVVVLADYAWSKYKDKKREESKRRHPSGSTAVSTGTTDSAVNSAFLTGVIDGSDSDEHKDSDGNYESSDSSYGSSSDSGSSSD